MTRTLGFLQDISPKTKSRHTKKRIKKAVKKYAKRLNKKISKKLSVYIVDKKTGIQTKRKVNCKCIGKYCACRKPSLPFGSMFGGKS